MAAVAAASIPFRRETEIGEPALGASHLGDALHLLAGKRKIEDVDVFRQPLDLRGPRDRADTLLHQPAQADLRRGLAVGPADLRQRRVALDAAFRHRTIRAQPPPFPPPPSPHPLLLQIWML